MRISSITTRATIRPRPTLEVSGCVEAWPPELADNLPPHDWMAVMAMPRQDKILVRSLKYRQIPGLILYERRKRTYPGKGSSEHLVPLIGAWVFVHGTDPDPIWATERAIRVLSVRQEIPFVRELGDLIALTRRSNVPLVVKPELVPGVRVRVATGMMAGLYGVVVRRRGHLRLVVNLAAMGTSVSVELPAETVEEARPEMEPDAAEIPPPDEAGMTP